ncbi:MAG: monovalent cation/H(+) antiporter subunit G [Anaerolineales bacterium]|nr:monovalent cation/H(+) antiporter subunit G [Anaerolineales bacterium]
MNDLVASFLLFIGSVFLLLAGIGIIRMPDLYSRIQASTKAATLGVGCVVLAMAFHFIDLGVTIRSLLVIAFLFTTAPVAAHVIGRAAYFVGVPLWDMTIIDELQGRYDVETHALRSPKRSRAGTVDNTRKTTNEENKST